jgi:hypothetical protein
MAANNLLKIQLHSIAREKLVALKQFPSLPFHCAEFSNANYLRPLNTSQIKTADGKYEPNKEKGRLNKDIPARGGNV